MNSINRLPVPTWMLILQLVSAILLIFYIYHINKNATMWYVLKELQEEREELLSEKEMLNLKISKSQSLSNLESDVYISDMIWYSSVVYINKDIKLAIKK